MNNNDPITDQEIDEYIEKVFQRFTQQEQPASKAFLVQELFVLRYSLMTLLGDQTQIGLKRFVALMENPENADSNDKSHLAWAYSVAFSIEKLQSQ